MTSWSFDVDVGQIKARAASFRTSKPLSSVSRMVFHDCQTTMFPAILHSQDRDTISVSNCNSTACQQPCKSFIFYQRHAVVHIKLLHIKLLFPLTNAFITFHKHKSNVVLKNPFCFIIWTLFQLQGLSNSEKHGSLLSDVSTSIPWGSDRIKSSHSVHMVFLVQQELPSFPWPEFSSGCVYVALDNARYHHRLSWMSGIMIDAMAWFWEENETSLLNYLNRVQMFLGAYTSL